MTSEPSATSTNLSEQFAHQYRECQDAFTYVLAKARDAQLEEEQYATLCGALARKLVRLRKLGRELAELRQQRADQEAGA